VNFEELSARNIPSESSKDIRHRVIKARDIQTERFKDIEGIYCNAQMRSNEIKQYCVLDDAGTKILKTAMEKLQLSARAYDRILKVARTIADLDNSESIQAVHVAEAVHYRSLDRQNWGGE
jgi:magnesium chelatase family protein